MKLLTILFTLLLSASAVAQENRITVSGFWAGMSASEFEDNCIAREYFCRHHLDGVVSGKGGSFLDYTNDYVLFSYVSDSSVRSIFIYCGYTNTCSINSHIELQDLLISEGIVDSCDSFCNKVGSENRLEVFTINNYWHIRLYTTLKPTFD